MKTIEFRKKSNEDLRNELLNIRKAQLTLRIQYSIQQSKNSSQFVKLRKDVARIKTILNERSYSR